MNWLALIVALVGLLRALVDFLQRRQQIATADAALSLKALDDAKTRLEAIRAASDAGRTGELHDDIFRD